MPLLADFNWRPDNIQNGGEGGVAVERPGTHRAKGALRLEGRGAQDEGLVR